MGFGGKVSLIGCKVGVLNRLPASFFVSVAYDCWAYRRLGVMLDASTGAIKQWLYRDPAVATMPMMDQAGFQRTGREIALQRAARRSHRPLAEGRRRGDASAAPRTPAATPCIITCVSHAPPVDLRGGVIYHCGPVVAKHGDGVEGHGGGSDHQHPRGAVSGRHHRQVRRPGGDRQGRHGRKTLAGLKEHGAVYLNAIGGAAQFYARCIERVDGVSLLEFGTPEAMWHLQFEGFPGDRDHGRAWQQPAQGDLKPARPKRWRTG